MLKIIDLKVGNIGSVVKALDYIGAEYELIDDSQHLIGASKILLPGVGSFDVAAKQLIASGFYDALQRSILEEKIPILGICVGMQLLAKFGYEGGKSKGLGFIDAEVVKIECKDDTIRVPHMGWNSIDYGLNTFEIFDGNDNDGCYYFVHSYHMVSEDQDAVTATVQHGADMIAYINKGHIYGAQFHPEKSQAVGLQFLRNFIVQC